MKAADRQDSAKNILSLLLMPSLIVSALGYFVDTFDIVIFSVTRVASLTDLGFSGELLTQKGIFLMNMQLVGMLIGGVLWGCIGDQRGRSSALVFSILCYSLANIANAFVDTIEAYAVCRFVSGIGLAGELGAAVTLVMETLPKKKRGLGAMLITFVGSLGALTASMCGGLLPWRYLYFIGGALGLLLLLARAAVKDSDMFIESKKQQNVSRGNALMFFKNWQMFRQFMACFMIGTPHYLFWAVIITLSPEILAGMGLGGIVQVPAILTLYVVMLSIGDLCATGLSQYIQSRKRIVIIFSLFSIATVLVFLSGKIITATGLYTVFGLMGLFAGYVMLVPIVAAETFGTNLRVTAASVITNCVRASAILMNMGIIYLRDVYSLTTSVQIVAGIVMALALIAAFSLRETFHKDMNFINT